MRPNGSPKLLERRRRKAVALLSGGLNLSEVARRTGASVSSVHRWQQLETDGGEAALAPKPVPGRPPKLRPEQCQRLFGILLQGAMAWGFPNDMWTLKRIVRVIRKEFGVRYAVGHVWKLLRRSGWSCQVPEKRAIQRDEEAIAHWKRYRWPQLKKTAKTWCPPRVP